MTTLKRIGPGSAFKVGAIIYAFFGLIVGVILAFVSLVAGSLGSLASEASGARAFGFGMGVGAIIVLPICYGLIGGIGGAIGAAIYNLVAGWVGGVEVEIS